ncbi:MAG: hypothetical protein HRT74_00610 [Flavobacteriales bacterium]|nr:hypothetical protein [Flavobacteriales bacterium]
MTNRVVFLSFLSVGFFLLSRCVPVSAQITVFEGNESATWEEAIERYQSLADEFPDAKMNTIGTADIGQPIHLFVIDRKLEDRTARKTTLFINNGIHPGEPCGIDASLKLVEDLLRNPTEEMDEWLNSVRIAIIPVYNVGGALNRGCCSRANQMGPENYGFRGNARNLDLNRDFVKADSDNAKAFIKTFTRLHPHVFIDTHTSNGADYQYVMTMINTQPDKASKVLGDYVRDTMSPKLYAGMEERGFGMIPYVHTLGKTPDDGIKDFLETPRYSTGFAALFNCIGFTSETHMLKPFAQRVESTYQFLCETISYMAENKDELRNLQNTADRDVATQDVFPLQWELDTTQFRTIPFKGFTAEYPKSKITGQERLKYNQKKPFTKDIEYYDTYNTIMKANAPQAYVIPQAWGEVLERLRNAGVRMTRLENNVTYTVTAYAIRDFKSAPRVYEGHHMNTLVDADTLVMERTFFVGDYLIPVNQVSNRFIVETLEPGGMDSFFVWNFFDSAFQQKEWYSAYVFEDYAIQMLADDKELKQRFEEKQKQDEDFRENAQMQIYWLYTQSPFYEPSLNIYPIFRLEKQ